MDYLELENQLKRGRLPVILHLSGDEPFLLKNAIIKIENAIQERYQAYAGRETYLEVATLEACRDAICRMVVRGAPLIGFTALWGLVLWLQNHPGAVRGDFRRAAAHLKTARPTAVNLSYEIELALAAAEKYALSRGSLIG